jgi:hypothetical protein
LHLVATRKPQQNPLLVSLYTLGQDLHAKRVTESHDRLDDGAGIAGNAERGNE